MNMLASLKKIYAMLPVLRQRQLRWLTFGMLAQSVVELALAGAISLLGVALAAPDSLEKIAPLWRIYQMLPSFGDDIPSSIRLLILLMSMVCIATVLKNIITALMTYWQGEVSQSMSWDVATKIFGSYLREPYVWHTQKNPAELIGQVQWRSYVGYFSLGALQVFSQAGIIILLLVGALVVAPVVSIILYGVATVVALFVYRATQRKIRDAGELVANSGIAADKVVHAALYGIREVQIYRQGSAFYKSLVKRSAPVITGATRQIAYAPIPNWVLESLGMLLLLAGVIFMVFRGESVASITGTLSLMAATSWRILPAMNKIVGGILQLKANSYMVQKLLENHKDISSSAVDVDTRRAFAHSLELQDVSFTYPNASSASLKNVSLTIHKGSMVGLIGLSGAGKSTLVGVLTGLLGVDSGKVLVDGVSAVPSPGFLNIGYVPQSPYIVDATLAENVAFSEWGSPPDEERVRACCQMASIDFLDDLPDGIHTMLGDHGLRLSGGQVQRVAIARALYVNPDILLFDEATSALDGAAEAAIQRTVLNLRKNITIIVVAHRLTTVQGCDVLYWIDNGQIKQHGAVAEVLPSYEEFLQLNEVHVPSQPQQA